MTENREAAEAALDTSLVLESGQQTENPLSDAAFNAPAEEPKEPEAPKHPTTRDAIEKALEEAEGKDKEKSEKPKDDEKEEDGDKTAAKPRDETGKFSKAEEEAKDDKSAAEKPATGQDGDKTARQSEGRNHHEPPARFLPKAKEVWGNVPHAVKGEIARMAQEHEQEVSQYRESHEEYSKLAKFTDMAKQYNTTVNDALESYTRLDALMHSNPVEGLRQIMERFNINPVQYAEFITKNPHAAQAPVQRAPDPVVQQTSTEVQTLSKRVEELQQRLVERDYIEPFKASNPRFDELQDDIVFFLQSGKIPATLSATEKLEAAYDMAVRINPTSSVAPLQEPAAPAAAEPAPAVDLRGQKSVKGAPSGGHDPSRKAFKSNRDAASAALQELGI